jgi:DNA-binding transcriptional LysR family regulator
VRLVLREGVGLALSAMGGVGLLRIYDFAAKPFIAEGDLEAVLTDWSCGREPVYAVIPSRRNVPAKVRAFVSFARSVMVAAGAA